jgi:hypothetical protein
MWHIISNLSGHIDFRFCFGEVGERAALFLAPALRQDDVLARQGEQSDNPAQRGHNG